MARKHYNSGASAAVKPETELPADAEQLEAVEPEVAPESMFGKSPVHEAPEVAPVSPKIHALAIRSRRPSFCRCGRQFSSIEAVFAIAEFSAEQVAILIAEPNLSVRIIEQ